MAFSRASRAFLQRFWSSPDPPRLFVEYSHPAPTAHLQLRSVRRLKNDPQTQDIPIIGMSAYALASERKEAIATGCDEFDAKPIDFESLVATIRRVLAPHK